MGSYYVDNILKRILRNEKYAACYFDQTSQKNIPVCPSGHGSIGLDTSLQPNKPHGIIQINDDLICRRMYGSISS